MTGTAVAALPTTGDVERWSPTEKALVEAAGLTSGNGPQKRFAPRPVVEAFLLHARRTGLDPIARQIYCIERGGKWGTQVSIDGARLVAERTGQYRGQTPTEWTDGTMTKVPLREDGKIVRNGAGDPIMVDDFLWVEVWLQDGPPKAARAGVLREGFDTPLYAIANFDAYNAGSHIWKKMPALMLAKCAEMLALRKAFPQDLSGLYSTEEMQQAGGTPPPAPRTPATTKLADEAASEIVYEEEQPAEAIKTTVISRDWDALAAAVKTMPALTGLFELAVEVGEVGLKLPSGLTVGETMHKRRAALQQPPLVDEPIAQPAKRQWVREARTMRTRDEVRALYMEAAAASTLLQILEEIEAIERTLPDPQGNAATASEGWATPGEPSVEWAAEPADATSETVAGVLDDSIGGE